MLVSGVIRAGIAAIFIALVILSMFAIYGSLHASALEPEFKLVGYGWYSPADPERAYPGSSKVRYYVSLLYTGGNRVNKVYAELYLPKGITTYSEGLNVVYSESDAVLDRYDVVTLEFSEINISNTLRVGTYQAELRLSYFLVGGATYTITMYVPLVISGIPSEPSEVVDYYWSTRDGLRRSLTPGFKDASLHLYMRVKDSVTVRNVYATLMLPEGLTCGGLRNATSVIENARYVKGDLVELRFNGIDVDDTLSEGELNLTIYVNFQLDLYGLTTNVTQYYNLTSTIRYEALNVLGLVNSFWGRDEPVPLYPNTSKAALSAILMNVGTENVYGLTGRLSLPEGFTHIYGEGVVNTSYPGRLSPGATVTLVFDNINLGSHVAPGTYMFKLVVEYFIESGGSSIKTLQEFNIPMQVLGKSDPVSVIAVSWANEYGVAFPASREELDVVLSNWDEYAVDLIEPAVSLPKGFRLLSIGGGLPKRPTSLLHMFPETCRRC